MGKAAALYDQMWTHLENSDFDAFDALFTEDVEITFQDARFTGAAALRRYMEAVMQALPDLTHEVVSVVEGDDGTSLAGLVIARGTHAGPAAFFGTTVDVTGRASTFQAVDLMWLENGRFAKWWAMYDPIERARSLNLTVGVNG